MMESSQRNESDIHLIANQTGERIRSNSTSSKSNSNSGEWKRAIPEAGYITLGTIRYGVKLNPNPGSTLCLHSRSTSLTTADANRSSSEHHHPLQTNNNGSNLVNGNSDDRTNIRSDSDNSSSDVPSINGSCCLNASKIPLPWLGKMDHEKVMTKNRTPIGVSNARNPPNERRRYTTNVDQQQHQQPFSTSNSTHTSDKSLNINSALVQQNDENDDVENDNGNSNSNSNDTENENDHHTLTLIESNRESSSSPICCYNSVPKINNTHKLCGGGDGERKQQTNNFIKSGFQVTKNLNNQKNKNNHLSPTQSHRHRTGSAANTKTSAICECGPFQSCHNRKFAQSSNVLTNNNNNNVKNLIDANPVKNYNENESFFGQSNHNDQCCYCCYSDCKKDLKFLSCGKFCDVRSFDCYQPRSNKSQKCSIDPEFKYLTKNSVNNNNCKLYRNQNSGQSLCGGGGKSSDVNSETDTVCSTKQSTFDVRNPFHSSQFYIDAPSSSHGSTWDQSNKCEKINNKIDLASIPINSKSIQFHGNSTVSSHRRHHSASDSIPIQFNLNNCSDCIGQLDKELINRIKSEQTNPLSIFDEQQKLVCCTKNVTAVRKLPQLFSIGNGCKLSISDKLAAFDNNNRFYDTYYIHEANTITSNPKHLKHIDRINGTSSTATADEKLENIISNHPHNINNNRALTSIPLARKESHSEKEKHRIQNKNYQIINYNCAAVRCEHNLSLISSNFPQNSRKNGILKKNKTHNTHSKHCDDANDNDVDIDNDNDNDEQNLCHSKKLNLANRKICSTENTTTITNHQYKSGATPAAQSHEILICNDEKSKQNNNNNNNKTNNNYHVKNGERKLSLKNEEKQENGKTSVTTIAYATPANIIIENKNYCENLCEKKRSPLPNVTNVSNVSNVSNIIGNDSNSIQFEENILLSASNQTIANDECMLFEHKPIIPSNLERERFLQRRASFDNHTEGEKGNLSNLINHRRTYSSGTGGAGGETLKFDRFSRLNRSCIESFSDKLRFIQNTDHRYAHSLTATIQPNSMEKRRNTLDRWQRLRFGRRAASNPPEDKRNPEIESAQKRSSDKTERLRELTELLKVPRNSSNHGSAIGLNELTEIPPLPPPRKQRPSLVGSGSIEKFIDTSASESGSPTLDHKYDHSVSESKCGDASTQSLFYIPMEQRTHTNETLRSNASATNLDSFSKTHDKSAISLPEENISTFKSTDSSSRKCESAQRTESKPMSGSSSSCNSSGNSCAQKSTPFRSASFSQIDYSSGKYIRSALGALKASFAKARSPPIQECNSPKKDRSRSSSPDIDKLKECTDIWIPLKDPCDKRNNLNLDLIDAAATSNIILEEENENSPTSVQNEFVSIGDENDLRSSLPFRVINAAEMTVDSPRDEGVNLQNVDDIFQTMNADMIPTPVFECARIDSNDSHLADKWINACEVEIKSVLNGVSNAEQSNDIPAFAEIGDEDKTKTIDSHMKPEAIDQICGADSMRQRRSRPDIDNSNELRRKTQSPTLDIDDLPAIAVTPGSSISGSSFEEVENGSGQPRSDTGPDYVVEVRKRNSNEDKNNENRNSDSTQSTSTSGTNSPKSHHDEKRRMDKSKRRKGIYIQWAALDKHNKELNAMSWSGNEAPLDLSDKMVPEIDANGQPIWPIGAYRSDHNNEKTPQNIDNSLSSLDPISPDFPSAANNKRLHRMDSIGKAGADETIPASAAYDVYTPDSDCGRQPIWPSQSTLQSRRQSLSLQSSEEKDESQMTSNSPPKSKSRSKIFLLRSDSTSDNEFSDRGHLSRDRASQSPAPDQDLKRYSKRPLRGPYGQMLEAEMKKPAKQNYDGLLEELNRSESPYMLSAKNRDSNLTSCEDIYSPHYTQRSISMGKPSTPKTESSLPLPFHTRAASTPAHMETPRPETIQHHHKRYPSCVETSPRKDTKKFSMDSYHGRNVDDRHTKRALSESKEKIGKRNSSSPAAISLLNVANEKLQRFNQENFKQKSEPIKASPELLAELLRGSSEKMTAAERQRNKKTTQIDSIVLPAAVQRFLDTRTHIVVELFNTEKSYVESLETVVKKYLNPLKSPENASLIESQTVDEIFLMVPTILHVHQQFLDELRGRLEIWEPLQRIGDAFVQVFSTSTVLETYTLFVNNVNRAKAAIRTTCNQRPAFARFLETMAREHKGKLTLDNLLIKPVQKFPNYELMFQRLIKHTNEEHPDQKPLQEALKLVHDILLHLNCKEREALENDQREAALRELENVIEGISDLVSAERQFLSFDLVSMPHGQGGRKERGFFLFNDLLIITSIKRRSGTIKKPSTTCPTSVASTLDTNKYKLLMKVSVEDLDIIKAKDENVRRIMREIENLTEDCTKLQQMLDVAISLRSPHQTLEENIRELHKELQRQLNDRQTNDSQLCILELAVNQTSQPQHMTVVFPKSEKRTHWEKMFNEIKQKLSAVLDHQPIPKFISSIPIRKTRAGLQFTCAASTIGEQKDVWICNSDGYVGQVCVLSLLSEPTVTSCNGVCNARILCLASVPACSDRPKLTDSIASLNTNSTSSPSRKSHGTMNLEKKTSTKSIASNDSSGGGTNSSSGTERDIQLDSSSSSDDSDELEQQQQQQSDTQQQPQPLRRLNSAKASSTPQLSSSAPNSGSDRSHGITDDTAGSDTQKAQPTMWLGTEDGCIHVYNCTDNIRTKKNKIKIQLVSAIYSILYLDDRVFVSLANGELVIYSRDYNGGWNTTTPHTLILGSATNPISKLINVNGKLWCSVQGTIKVMNSATLQVENQMQISPDIKPITNMAVYNNQVWISVQNSASIKCFHSKSLALLFEVNLAPSVNKMLSSCDDIIRQHKAACLRVTSLLACRDLIWIGTSAGVILTIPATTCKTTGSIGTYNSVLDQPIVTGIPYGHTGHVRFLTCVDYSPKMTKNSTDSEADNNPSQKKKNASSSSNKAQALASKSSDQNNLLIISGGDGFEDFRTSSTNALSDIAGREDSTNHLLLWQV